MRKASYYAINTFVILCSLPMLYSTLKYAKALYFQGAVTWLWIFAAAISIACVQLLKASRMYLIIMELHIGMRRFAKTYTKSTLMLLIFPYKLGEIFRAFCYGADTRNFPTGIMSVLVDRFFDSLPLATLLIFYVMAYDVSLSVITIIIILFIIVATFFYFAFPSTSRYLNRFIITNIRSKYSMSLLYLLDILDGLHSRCVVLVKERALLLVFLSSIAWFFEYVSLFFIANALSEPFSLSTFARYLDSIFSGNNSALSGWYTILSILLISIFMLIIYVVSYAKKVRV